MKLPSFDLRIGATQADVLAQLSALGSDCRILAGGQTLLPWMRYRVVRPSVLLAIGRVADLDTLVLDGTLRIGANVRHAQLEDLPPTPARPIVELLRRHAAGIAFRPIRQQGTVVGSLALADPKGDWPLLFCALDAQLRLDSVRGSRQVPMRRFIRGPLEVDRAVDELVSEVQVPELRARLLSFGRNKLCHRAGEYAMASAVVVRRTDGFDCWAGALGDAPVTAPSLAAELNRQSDSAAARPSSTGERARYVEAALMDLRRALPDEAPIPLLRHAENLVDAAEQALHGTHA